VLGHDLSPNRRLDARGAPSETIFGMVKGGNKSGGGNAHQRAIAAKAAGEKVGPEMVIPGTELRQENARRGLPFRTDFSLAFLVAVVTALLSVFPPDTKIHATIWIVALIILSFYPVLHLSYWWTREEKRKTCVLTVILLLILGAWLHSKFWQNFHSFLSFAAEPDLLASTVPDSNPIRLSVTEASQQPIQNLDLTVHILDKSEDYLRGMHQMSNIPGVWITGPEVPDATAWVKGPDGQSFALSAQDALGELPIGRHWVASCPRLTPDSPLRLAIGTITKDKNPPKGIRVSGDYEVVENGGIRVVTFDEVVKIIKSD
jgi:hypothetical protein